MAFSRVSSSFLLCAVLRLFVVAVIDDVQGLPQIMVNSPKSKCFFMEVPADTQLRVTYEVSGKFDFEAFAPTYITVVTTPSQAIIDMINLGQGPSDRLKERLKKEKPTSMEITEPTQSFEHHVKGDDAKVQLCVRSSKASPTDPFLIHLQVEIVDVIKDFFQSLAEKRPPMADVEHHWSFLETQMDRIEHEMHRIIREANFFRERDASYHQKMDGLNKATVFWPMLHCFIIVLTGFTQANHVIAFFRKRRII